MNILHTETAVSPSKKDEENIIAIHDLLEEGRPRKATKMILSMRDKFFKNLRDYYPMFRTMRNLKRSGNELAFSHLHHRGDKTVVRFIRDLKNAQNEHDIECLFMTVEGGCDCPRSQDVRIKNTDLFVHYLQSLYEAIELARSRKAVVA